MDDPSTLDSAFRRIQPNPHLRNQLMMAKSMHEH